MDYAGTAPGASPKDGTSNAANSKKSLGIVEIMQQTMAEDVSKNPGSQTAPEQGSQPDEKAGGTMRTTPKKGGLDEPSPADADLAQRAVYNLEISK